MTAHTLPSGDYRGYGIAAFVLAVAGWAGLVYLVIDTIPGPGPRWLFFIALLMALTGTAAPFVHYLNRRFARWPVPSSVLLRQALWVGFVGATCAWLQISRTLNLPTALLLISGLGAIEWFLRWRERSRWVPGIDDDESA